MHRNETPYAIWIKVYRMVGFPTDDDRLRGLGVSGDHIFPCLGTHISRKLHGNVVTGQNRLCLFPVMWEILKRFQSINQSNIYSTTCSRPMSKKG